VEKEAESLHQGKRKGPDLLENRGLRSNGISDAASEQISDRQPDIVDDHPSKSRSSFFSLYASFIGYFSLIQYEVSLILKLMCRSRSL